MRTHPVSARKGLAVLFTALVALSASCTKKTDSELVIYAYDSFASEWGPAPKVIPAFEAATGIKVELVVPGDAGQALARVIEEKKAPVADIIIGVDGNLLPKALEAGVLAAYKPKGSDSIPSNLRLDPEWRLTPYDWSSFCVMWDSERLATPPASLEDLAKPEYAKKFVVMDPRTSTPGLGFVEWTKAVYGDGAADYWKRLSPSILTMAPGWDTGYGLFTSGEAPLVVSYTTSAAYHAEYETAGRYKALEFAEGHPMQVEGAGIVAGARHRKAAEAFIDFMLTEAFQSAIPTTNWMYPVMPDTPLPASYAASPKPAKTLPRQDGLDLTVKAVLDALQGR